MELAHPSKKIRGFLSKESGIVLKDLAGLLARHRLSHPTIDRRYPLAQAPDVMRPLETGNVRGKVAVSI